jgi:hypothetical protein
LPDLEFERECVAASAGGSGRCVHGNR